MRTTQIKDIMSSEVISIDPDLGLNVALETMRANGIRRLPVLSKTRRVVGIISRADAEIGVAKASEALSLDPGAMPIVRDVMADFVHTIGPEDSVAKAAITMVNQEIGCLPVVDADHHVVGIVTESDLFKFIANKLTAEEAS